MPITRTPMLFMTLFLCTRDHAELARSLVQQGIELGPHLIFLGAGLMAKGALRLRFQLGSWSLRLVMIEVVVTPTSAIGIALRVLDRHIGTIPRPGEIASSRRLHSRAVGVLRRQRKLQLLEKDRPFRKYVRLLVLLV